MKNLLEKDTKCLIIQSEFSKFSFWNYVDICKLLGAKYPAPPLGLMTAAALQSVFSNDIDRAGKTLPTSSYITIIEA